MERYFEDPQVLHIGTCEPKSYIIPYQNAEVVGREKSEFFTLLNGEWRFKYFTAFELIDEDFKNFDYDDSSLDTIKVPGVWQTAGYDSAQYITSPYPIPFDPPHVPNENPTACYIRDFNYNKTPGRRYYLNFEGVDSAFYLWLNGEFLGYSQVSHATHTFDITDRLQKGKNRLAAAVLKWCDGSYLEDQDKIRMNGIFRDVYILERAENHITDYKIKTDFNDDYTNAQIDIEIEYLKQTGNEEAELLVTGPDGDTVFQGRCKDKVRFCIADPQLWSAETPLLYKLVISFNGEYIVKKFGLRKIEVREGLVCLNGRPIKLRGVNRHDSNPRTGYTVTVDDMYNDLLLMKRCNINAIRTSHYPNDPRFYEMCDRLGFYVMEEADLESHGCLYTVDFGFISDSEDYKKACLDRMKLMYERDKNNTCTVFWSLGNESGWGRNLLACAEYLKNSDPSRLIHYESMFGMKSRTEMHGYDETEFYDSARHCIDVFSRMYSSFDVIDEFLSVKTENRPFMLCEYTHAMGNSCGDIYDYFEQIYANDRLFGAFVWEWCDHALVLKDGDGAEYFGYGGDFGEKIHSRNFCLDGLVSPEREPHPSYFEVKNVYSPVRIYSGKDGYRIYNRNDFERLQLTLKYEISTDGVVQSFGEIDCGDIAPHDFKTFNLPEYPGRGLCAVVFRAVLKADTEWAQAGAEVYTFSEMLKSDISGRNAVERPCKETKLLSDKVGLKVKAGDVLYTFSTVTGMLTGIELNGRAILKAPMGLTVFRAPIDNELPIFESMQKPSAENYRYTLTHIYSFDTKRVEDGLEIKVPFSFSCFGMRPISKGELTYRISDDGSLTISQRADIRNDLANYLPRYGYLWQLCGDCEHVEYYGLGPHESYCDRFHSEVYGRFAADIKGLSANYLRPQENGSRFDTKWLKIGDKSMCLYIKSDRGFSFNASYYSPEQIYSAKHPFELQKSENIYLHTDYFMAGVGSAACGPELDKRFALNGGETVDFTLTIKPCESDEDGFDLFYK